MGDYAVERRQMKSKLWYSAGFTTNDLEYAKREAIDFCESGIYAAARVVDAWNRSKTIVEYRPTKKGVKTHAC